MHEHQHIVPLTQGFVTEIFFLILYILETMASLAKLDPLAVFKQCKLEKRPVYIAGPMVRYSKLPFRELMRDYGADIVYSPMILAREFVRNSIARLSDFSTNKRDKVLIVQVGTNNVVDLLRFVEMIHPYCDGIGINCGCPVKEQVREGIGAALMSDADKVAAMVKAVKDKYGALVRLETKIRIHSEIRETVEFARKVEAAGVDWITVHGRTKDTRSSQPADMQAIRIIKESIKSVPVVANGDCFAFEDIARIAEQTNVDGIMAVRGVLNNPCLFQGFKSTTWGAVERFWNYSLEYGLPYRIIQHHLSCMMENGMSKQLRRQLNECNSMVEMIDWFDDNFNLKRIDQKGYGESMDTTYLSSK